MEIEIDLRKTIHENANEFFEKGKKARKKLEGVIKAIAEQKKRIQEFKEKKLIQEIPEPEKKRKKKWFEAFHWMHSSEGFLVIGGRDAQSNEVIVKKHMQESDLYFHADIHGAPHCIIKTEGKQVPEKTMKEAAIFAAVFSKAWEQKLNALDVYSVKPSQVSKKAPSGESLGTGAFMIYGERNWFKNTSLEFGIGLKKEEENYVIISGALNAVEKNSETFFELIQGNKKKSEIAKELKQLFQKKLAKIEEKIEEKAEEKTEEKTESKEKTKIDLDEIIKMLPNGESEVKK